FYWNTRSFVSHVWPLLASVHRVPKAPVYHAACTGYAGMLGALLRRRNGGRYLLTEHGIYVKERIEDLRTGSWIRDHGKRVPELAANRSALLELWSEFFLFQARISYDHADQIASLFERNAKVQAEFGADRGKISIIPNGVAPPPESPSTGQSKRHDGLLTVGFLGRVVPIKDIKTLIRSAAAVRDQGQQFRLLIAGPTEEDPAYFEQCLGLRDSLALDDIVEFIGKVPATEFLQSVDVVIFTSISEGLPFAILEAFNLGVPVVATDVGACRELIEGRDGGGVRGAAGLITDVAEPEHTACALIRLLGDEELRARMGAVGRRRVEEDYRLTKVVDAYTELYDAGSGPMNQAEPTWPA
ncbi:MAG: GT4 family glycosyltransferase PelF, partial [Phycisphaerales bacterium]|nr:GT4 family glycosyltransferase PelF [Phycisphaerales bacterium]